MIDFYRLIEIAKRVNKDLTLGEYNEELGIVLLKTEQRFYPMLELHARIIRAYFKFEDQATLERDFSTFVMESGHHPETLVRVHKNTQPVPCDY